LIESLLQPKTEEDKSMVAFLLEKFEFYIIPMLNVDGVINGNYRCSLASCDLNRKWGSDTSEHIHPSIYASKKLISEVTQGLKKEMVMFIDFHGHSAKKNVFMYGNDLNCL
jgi:murein tripeptide amidase MpaA